MHRMTLIAQLNFEQQQKGTLQQIKYKLLKYETHFSKMLLQTFQRKKLMN